MLNMLSILILPSFENPPGACFRLRHSHLRLRQDVFRLCLVNIPMYNSTVLPQMSDTHLPSSDESKQRNKLLNKLGAVFRN